MVLLKIWWLFDYPMCEDMLSVVQIVEPTILNIKSRVRDLLIYLFVNVMSTEVVVVIVELAIAQ